MAGEDIAWTLAPGQTIERKQLHEQYGGRTQGGIGPSKGSPNVFLFTDPISGEKHGYFDGQMPDGTFHYTGEGQLGDQRMISGNASILNHEAEGRALRLFQGARGIVTYLGEYRLAENSAWYETDAPESGGDQIRKVIVFRLLAVDKLDRPLPQTSLAEVLESTDDGPVVRTIAIEQHLTERTFINPNREPYAAERKEAELVTAFAEHIRRAGHTVTRHEIWPEGERRPLYTDVHVPELELLVEAKGSVTRENVRMAIGQLADYSRFTKGVTKRAVLLPSRPRPDLLTLLSSQEVAAIWREGGTFKTSDLDLAI
jgi:hypothetical protein